MGIKEIAAEAGVSKTTVSLALNGHKGVSDETRTRILEIARRMNYRLPSERIVHQESKGFIMFARLSKRPWIIAIVIAPPAEEAVFRGLIYPTIKRLGYPRLALWGTTLLFAAIHWNLASFLPLVLLALVLTWLYERTGNLLAPMVTHALFNAVNFMALQLVESH